MDEFTVRVPKEITQYKEKIKGVLTFRQAFALTASAAVIAVAEIFLRKILPQAILPAVCMIPVSCILAVGFLTYQGMHAEKFAGYIARAAFVLNRPLEYETDADNAARKYYLSHLSRRTKIRSALSKKAREDAKEYWKTVRPALAAKIASGETDPNEKRTRKNAIRPRRLTSEERRSLRKAEEERKKKIEEYRRKQLVIKQRTDERRAEIMDTMQRKRMAETERRPEGGEEEEQ